MTALADIVEELKRLPEQELRTAADFIHQLAEGRRQRRLAMLQETAGSLNGPEGEALETAVAECSRVDESAW